MIGVTLETAETAETAVARERACVPRDYTVPREQLARLLGVILGDVQAAYCLDPVGTVAEVDAAIERLRGPTDVVSSGLSAAVRGVLFAYAGEHPNADMSKLWAAAGAIAPFLDHAGPTEEASATEAYAESDLRLDLACALDEIDRLSNASGDHEARRWSEICRAKLDGRTWFPNSLPVVREAIGDAAPGRNNPGSQGSC